MSVARRPLPSGYEADFHAWTWEQARLLREGKIAAIDTANLAEELETTGRSDQQEIENRLTVLLHHLLKYEHQPNARSGSWRGQIFEQRMRIARALQRSPSLRRTLDEAFASGDAYDEARQLAALETGLPIEMFPDACPHAAESILDPNFWPGQGPHPDLGGRERRKLRLKP